jgi:amino acid adenylation domain-containing protein
MQSHCELVLVILEKNIMSDLLQKLENLSPKKRELVLKKLQKQKLISTIEHGYQPPLIVPVPRAQAIPLSFAQARLWFLNQLEGESATYNMPAALRIMGALQVAALEMAVQEIVRRHEVLRTTFEIVNGSPVQVIDPTLIVALPVVDLQSLSEIEQSAEVRRLTTEEAQCPFNLAKGTLPRVTLLRLGEEEYVLLVTMHHIVSDGWSIGIFIRELSTLYEAFSTGAPSPLPELPIQYADFAHWQRQWLSGDVLETQLNYWQQQLASAPPVLELPTDQPRSPVQTFRGSTEDFQINRNLTKKLNTLSQESGTTLFMTLLAAFVTLLSHYSGQEDIVVGSAIANRNHSEIESLIGFFVNTLVLRTDLKGNPSFSELLQRVRQVALDAYAHQDVPFEQLVEALQPERSLSHSPLFQVMFILQNAPMGKLELPSLTLTPLEIESVTAKFDLTLSMTETEQGLMGVLEYNSDLFDGDMIARIAGHFQTLLAAIVANPQQRVSELPLLTAAQRHQLLVEWNDTQTEYCQNQCIHQLFEAQVQRTPEAVAVVFDMQQLTYRELNARANQLAHHLQVLGVEPEVLVGICVERSIEMVVGLLGILKAGGAYVPLDPAYPKERLAYMLSDAQVPVLLTLRKLVARLPEHRAHLVCLDTDWGLISRKTEQNPLSGAKPTSLAYALYTSGSTGRPKGVAIEHHSPVALLNWTREVFTTEQLAGVLASTSICFDLSVFELFAPLSWGGKVILVENALYLPTLPAALNVTLINTVPSAIAELLKVDGVPASVHTVNLAGEPLQNSLVQRLYQQDTIQQVFNLYGPSEDTTYSTFALMNKGDRESPTIGRPIANTQIYILDNHLQPVPIGVPGELHIGGAGLARGYLNRPDLTREKFIPNPFSDEPQARLYKTGDLARYLPDGNIQFLVRRDHQVKIRGFRIEIGEIEAVLSQHPDVREAVVIARDDQPGNKRLVAYVVPNQELGATASELRRLLKEKLPDYMVPSAFVILKEMPLTPNGKVDRRGLPAPDSSQRSLETSFVPPRTPTEALLAAIWSDILGLEVGIHDNFFEVGGHSLQATQVISRLREAFCVELPLRRLFESPTIAELSEFIEAVRRDDQSQMMSSIQPVSRDGELPLSFAQARLWFLDQLEGGSAAYNMPAAVWLNGQLNVAALEMAVQEIVQRHEVLRTTLKIGNGSPVQVIAPTLTVTVPVVDLQALPEEEQSALVRRLATEEAQQPFDLSNGPLLRVTLVRLGQESHVLLVTVHHIVSDGWSMGIFIREVAALYEAFCTKAPSPLPELPVQYADFAHWQRQWLSGEVLETQLNYWQQQLTGAPPVLDLPTDHPRPPVQSFRGSTEHFEIGPDLTQRLKNLSQQSGTTLFMTLLAAFVTLLYRYNSQEDIVVASPIANRNRAEIEGLIGFFANTLALRIDVSGEPTFQELLGRVREVTMGAYAHQDLPFEKLVEVLQPERALSRNPLVQVGFALQNAPMGSLRLPGLSLSRLEFDSGTVRLDLEFHLLEVSEGLRAYVHYSTDLFEAATIIRMTGHFLTLLEGIVANPNQQLLELSLLTEAERQQLLVTSNSLPTDSYSGQLFAQMDQLSDEEVNALLNKLNEGEDGLFA